VKSKQAVNRQAPGKEWFGPRTGESIGTVVSTHETIQAAVKARLDVGQPVQPAHLAESK
jgi:hypothetical protein